MSWGAAAVFGLVFTGAAELISKVYEPDSGSCDAAVLLDATAECVLLKYLCTYSIPRKGEP